MAIRTASSTIVTFVCSFLFLFTFLFARHPIDSTGIDIDHANHDHGPLPVHEKNPDDTNSILLPIEKLEIEPATLIQYWEPKTTDSKTSKPKAESLEQVPIETSEDSDPDPFTVFSVRPMDPRIPRRPLPLSFRLGHRCHHNHHYKPWKPLLPHRETPHRNDVIMNNIEDKDFDKVARGGMHHIPARWTSFRHIEPMFSRERNMALDRSELLRRLYLRHHHRRPEEENKDTGLMKRIRKFLNHF